MGECTDVEEIKSARKSHRCSWCAEQIEIGQPYKRWRCFGSEGPTVCKLHPECADAERESAQDWGNEEWSMYNQPRGCNCGFSHGCERCEARKLMTHNALNDGLCVNPITESKMQPKLTKLWIGQQGDAATGNKTIRADFSNDRHFEVVISNPANAEQVARALLQMSSMIRLDPLLAHNLQ